MSTSRRNFLRTAVVVGTGAMCTGRVQAVALHAQVTQANAPNRDAECYRVPAVLGEV